MIYTNLSRFVLLSAILLYGLTLTAQKVKESVILYNGQPVRALLDDKGNIVKIVATESGYLQAKDLEVPDYDKNLRHVTTESIDNAVISHDPIKMDQSQEVVIQRDQKTKTEWQENEGAILSKDVAIVHFDKNMAILSTRVRNELDEIILILKSSPEINILAMTLSKTDNDLVTSNRLSAIKAYLKLRGISENRIEFKAYYSDSEASDIKVQFQRRH